MFDKDAKATQWRKKSFKQVVLEKLAIAMPKIELQPISCIIHKTLEIDHSLICET